ncbi:MAG: DUF3501 family protein [Alphaproteobacteria bacterium]|jgi:hypothetical protein
MSNRQINPDDIMDLEAYLSIRKDKRREMSLIKKDRRVEVGPFATFYFESYETMWHQVHEMLAIEKGGAEQVPDELEAYNPLIPQGRELIATVMFEIDDPLRRKTVLSRMGGVEENMYLEVNGERVSGKAEEDVDRTAADGKASSVQFVHFPLSDAQADVLKNSGARVIVGIDHENYSHMAVMSEPTRNALAGDLD